MSPGQQFSDILFSLFGTLISGLISTLLTTLVPAILEMVFSTLAGGLGAPQP